MNSCLLRQSPTFSWSIPPLPPLLPSRTVTIPTAEEDLSHWERVLFLGICWNDWRFFGGQSPAKFDQQPISNRNGDKIFSLLCTCLRTSVSFRAINGVERSATTVTADADCVLSVCLTLMRLFHSPWSWLLLSSPLLQRNESVCDVGWLLTVCPVTHIRVVLLSQHISVLPPPSLLSFLLSSPFRSPSACLDCTFPSG